MRYVARRHMTLNSKKYVPGQPVPDAEKLAKFRTLVSAGWLVKEEAAPSPPASPTPTDSSTGAEESRAEEPQVEEPRVEEPQVEEAKPNGVELRPQPISTKGPSPVPNRGHNRNGSASAGRGDKLRTVTKR